MLPCPDLLFALCLVTEPELLGRIRKNKVSKALFLTQKALLVHKRSHDSGAQTRSLLEVGLGLGLGVGLGIKGWAWD